MEITGPGKLLSPITLTAPESLAAWKAGQILDAVVVLPATNGAATLRIQNTLVQAQTTLNLAAGQKIQLQVTESGAQPVLKLITADSEPDILTQALRVALPKQGTLTPLLTALAPWARSNIGQIVDVPARVAAIAKQFFTLLPSLDQVTEPSGLKQALRDSGVFLENKLAQADVPDKPAAINADLKTTLLRLADELRSGVQHADPKPNPATSHSTLLEGLTEKSEAALARIQLNQIQMLMHDGAAKPTYAFDLPIRHEDRVNVFSLKIQREEKQHTAEVVSPVWSVWLDFDFEELGLTRALVSVHDKQVSVGLWAEKPNAAILFNDSLDTLHHDLAGAGLSVGRLHCQQGQAPAAPAPSLPPSLLDEKA